MNTPKMRPRVAKRSACDRCRDQKLRCPRTEEQADEPCIRCVRAGASCVTGSPRPLGRPRNAPMILQRRSNAPDTAVSDGEGQTSSRKRPRPAEHSPSRCNEDRLPGDSSLESQFSYAADIGETPEGTDLLNLDFYNGDMALLDSFHRPQDLNPAALQLNNKEIHNGHFTVLAGSLVNSFDPTRGAALHPYLPNNELPLAAPLPGAFESSEVLIKLARLNETITRQASCLASLPMGSAIVVADCAEKMHELDPGFGYNPASQALESTAELTTILKQVISPAQGTALTMPAVLLCLSSYIQLLQLYNNMFHYICQVVREIEDVVEVFEAAPAIGNIGGLPPVKGHLYVKIMVQVIQHHLGTIERLIGLPPELCLSERTKKPDSASDCVISTDLLRTVMTQTFVASDTSGRSLLVSLRANMKNVVEMLG